MGPGTDEYILMIFLVIALDVRHNMWAIEQLGEDLHFPSAFLLFSSVI